MPTTTATKVTTPPTGATATTIQIKRNRKCNIQRVRMMKKMKSSDKKQITVNSVTVQCLLLQQQCSNNNKKHPTTFIDIALNGIIAVAVAVCGCRIVGVRKTK